MGTTKATRATGAASAPVVLLDVSAFPVVRFDTSRVKPGYSAQWIAEMDAVLARGRRFVLVAGGIVKDDARDRKARSLFLKSRQKDFARWCVAIIGVEPTPVARAARRAQAGVLTKAFGIEMQFVATEDEAMALGRARVQ